MQKSVLNSDVIPKSYSMMPQSCWAEGVFYQLQSPPVENLIEFTRFEEPREGGTIGYESELHMSQVWAESTNHPQYGP